MGNAAPNGGNTPDIDDEVIAAMAFAAVAALKYRIFENYNFSNSKSTHSSAAILFLMSINSCGISQRDSFVVI